jgi:hypothetical protein
MNGKLDDIAIVEAIAVFPEPGGPEEEKSR